MRRRDFIKTPLMVASAAIASKAAVVSGLLAPSAVHAAFHDRKARVASIPDIALGNGTKIPQFGLGTWQLVDNATASVRAAIASGYRLFDTAQAYGNEKQVWEGVKQSGLARKDVYITSKISPGNTRKPPQKDSIERSIELLGGEYIDLFMIHWAVREGNHIQETWETMEEFVRKGLIKSIGFSNFNPHHIDSLLKYAKIKPVVNQIEIHPYHTQESKVEAIRGYGIAVQSWSPLARGRVVKESVISDIGKKYNKTAAQVTLRWHIQRGLVVIPRSGNPAHIAENIKIFDFELSKEEMATISGLNRNELVIPGGDPDTFPW